MSQYNEGCVDTTHDMPCPVQHENEPLNEYDAIRRAVRVLNAVQDELDEKRNIYRENFNKARLLIIRTLQQEGVLR